MKEDFKRLTFLPRAPIKISDFIDAVWLHQRLWFQSLLVHIESQKSGLGVKHLYMCRFREAPLCMSSTKYMRLASNFDFDYKGFNSQLWMRMSCDV